MRAAVIDNYGTPDVIAWRDVAMPTMADDDLLIKVAATSFNPADAAIRSGLLKSALSLTFPYTLGSDVSGVVAEVGGATSGFAVGDRVFAYAERHRNGAAAEFIACKASEVARAPASLPLAEAAAFPLAGCTAWQALFVHGGLQAGQRVLIVGAAGGVGVLAVQLARWTGACVIAVASSRRETLLRDLGADEVIDYQKGEALAVSVRAPVDLIFNLSPVDSSKVNAMLPLLKAGGLLVSALSPADPKEAERLGVRAIRMASQRSAEQLAKIAELVDGGALRPVITERLPASQTADVHWRAGKLHGKVLLIVDANLA